MSKPDGGFAFPGTTRVSSKDAPDDGSTYLGSGLWEFMSTGMSLRDWFAGQALSGLIAEHANPSSSGSGAVAVQRHAEWAYGLADAMLAERSKP